jgi:hypothetical protein
MPDRVIFLEQDVPSSAELLLFERKLSNREVCSVRASNWRSESDAHGAACFRTHHGQSQDCAFLKLREMMADPKQSEWNQGPSVQILLLHCRKARSREGPPQHMAQTGQACTPDMAGFAACVQIVGESVAAD